MTFEDAIKLIQDAKITHLKVLDTDGKKLMELNADSADSVIAQLEGYKNIMASNGRVKFVAANDSIYNQKWRDAYTWTIVFSTTTPTVISAPSGIGGIPTGYVSQNEASLMAKLEALTMQINFDKKFSELEKKLDLNKGDDFEKYLPFAGLLMDIDPKKLETMTALAGMQAAMNGKNQQGLAGLQEKKDLVQTTVEEKEQIMVINNELEKLSEKVAVSKIAEFIKALNDKPQFLDTLIAMSQAHK